MKPAVRLKFARDMELFDARVKGKPFDEIGKEFGISAVKARVIFQRARNYNNDGRLAFAFTAEVKSQLRERLEVVTLADLKNFFDEEPYWRTVLAKKCGFDKVTIGQIEGFARENGIVIPEMSIVDEVRVKDAVREYAKEKGISEKVAYAIFVTVGSKELGG